MGCLSGVSDMTSSARATAKPVRPAPSWEAIPSAGPDEFAKARTELLNLVQWPARIANSYVSGKMPEERVLLEFRANETAFVTQPFERDIALEIRIANLEMQFLDHGKPVPHIFNPEEHSPAKVEAWLLVELLHRGIDRSKFSKKLPYTVANLMTGDAVDHAPQECGNGLAQLAAWYRNAASVLAGGGEKLVVRPQTLNLTPLSKRANFGFSPGDGEISEPYFYANGRKRSVLTASQLAKESNPAIAAARFLGESA
jgi:hypothetical protein